MIYDKTKKQKFYIYDFTDNSTDNKVHFQIKCKTETISALICKVDKHIDSIEEHFKLSTKINLSNIHLFDNTYKIKKYEDIYQIIDDYFEIRLDLYKRRKKHQLQKLKNELDLNISKMKFIKDVINENIVVYKNTKKNIIESLVGFNYEKVDNSYNYLINMSLYNFTLEKIEELSKVIDKLINEYETLEKLTEIDIWKNELKTLKNKI